MDMHLFYSPVPLLDYGLCHQNHQACQILPGRGAFFSAAFLHHWNHGHPLWAADGCGDQCHPSQGMWLLPQDLEKYQYYHGDEDGSLVPGTLACVKFRLKSRLAIKLWLILPKPVVI